MAITTVEQVQAVLGIEGQEARIAALIPLVESDYVAIRNKPFDRDDGGNVIYPPGAEMTAIRMIGYHLAQSGGEGGSAIGIASESLGDYSISYETGGGSGGAFGAYPESITGGIRRYVTFV